MLPSLLRIHPLTPVTGVIEGSEESLSHENRYLDQSSYLKLSHRVQHVFAKQREHVYGLFKVYKRHKQQHVDSVTAERYVRAISIDLPELIHIQGHTTSWMLSRILGFREMWTTCR